jgi:quinol monooxygenase YgiN
MLRGLLFALVLTISVNPVRAQTPAPTPNPPAATGPVYTLTFFETGVGQAGHGAALLRHYLAATHKADGIVGALALHETARANRFALVETWRNKGAADAHANAAAALRNEMQPILAAPFDVRSNAGLDVAGGPVGSEPNGSRAIYVLTHVDVFPAGKDQTIEMLKQLAAESRKDHGNLRFDVLQQDGRANHLPLIEAWRDAQAQSAHAMAEHTRAFRAKLVSLQGALYDERLYRSIH